MPEGQHDDHVWLTVGGSAWAVFEIQRHEAGTLFFLWRGYEPHLEADMVMFPPGHDWEPYCLAAEGLLLRPDGGTLQGSGAASPERKKADATIDGRQD